MGTKTWIKGTVGAMALATMAWATPAAAQQPGAFDGAYAGANVGLEMYDDGITDETALYFGATGGWRKQTPSGLVYGGEFNLGMSTAKGSFTFLTLTTETDAGLEWGFNGIVGKVMGARKNMLLFGLLGYQSTSVDFTISDATSVPPLNLKTSDSDGGFRVGGGLEYQMSSKLHLRGTAAYTDSVSEFQFLVGAFMPF